MAKGYEMDMQHMPLPLPFPLPTLSFSLGCRTFWARRWASRLLEALQERPQSQRLGIIYMQIHTFQVQTQPTCRPKQQYTSRERGKAVQGEGIRRHY